MPWPLCYANQSSVSKSKSSSFPNSPIADSDRSSTLLPYARGYTRLNLIIAQLMRRMWGAALALVELRFALASEITSSLLQLHTSFKASRASVKSRPQPQDSILKDSAAPSGRV